ncbi:MAG TPA: phospholipase A2 [Dehalococcoidia bacterium]|nr:phospholipase A2 [Dehalococcoidia bacterium]
MTATRTWFLALTIAIVAFIALESVATTQASGLTGPETGHAVLNTTADNCGVMGVFDVPDSGPSFDFSQACANHDACYSTNHGTNEAARATCDNAFLNDMLTSCNDMWSRTDPQLYQCRTVAKVYYAGVRLGGWLFFYS